VYFVDQLPLLFVMPTNFVLVLSFQKSRYLLQVLPFNESCSC